ncbi:hypothetical protein RJ641_018688 [Dillenia turbinata]|uniref:Uncharacterized protein n=1 Tax=Dillenia turbinata TaxID=194707 RepID=A0AAN8YWU7_9MAGN
MSLLLLLLLPPMLISTAAASSSVVKTVPGFDGELPFQLETGYVGLGDADDVQLFYFFVKKQSRDLPIYKPPSRPSTLTPT